MKQTWGETTTTWNIASTGINWQVPGATGANDIESLDIGSRYFAANESVTAPNNEKQFGLDPAKIEEMVSGAFANNGFLLKADVELNDLYTFNSSRATSGQPKLVIVYTLPNPTATEGPSATPTNTPPGALSATIQRGVNGTVIDAWISNAVPTTNYGTFNSLQIGEDSTSGNVIRRTLLKFDFQSANIPANALIVSAQLSLWSFADNANFSRTYRVYRLKRAWTEGGATWNKYDATNSWEVAGATGPGDVEAKEIGWLPLAANEPFGEKKWQLDPGKIQEMVSGAFANNGFLLKADYEVDDLYQFWSSEAVSPNDTKRPRLVIYYLLPTSTPTLTLTPTLTPTPSNTPTDLIFKDGFESGNFSAWSSSVTDGGDLSVTTGAKLVGNYGIQALLDDTTAIYVQDTTPTSESRYRTRFYFDPNSLSMTSGDLHTIFEASNGPYLVFYINFKYSTTSGYQLKLKVRRDDGTYAETSYYTLSDAPHFVEVDWQGATTAGANNGAGTLWIDGILQEALTGIDDDTLRVESVKLGAVSGLDAIGTNKTYYFDSFDSRRVNPLGPDVTVGSGRNSVTGLIGGQQVINNTPIFTGANLPHTRGMSSYPTPSGPTIFATTTYSYTAQSATCPDGALTKPHAVTTAGSDTYCYDKNGNMVKRVEGGVTYTQNYDAQNQLASVVVNGQTTTFVYDGDGKLVKKIKPDGSATIYIGGIYEVEVNSSGTVTEKTSYYPNAIRVEIVGGSNTLYYLLSDHLGSATVTLKADGTIDSERRYYPFGETRVSSGAMPSDHLYTGQFELSELGGIYHYGARAYSPKLGRFLSADTIISPNNRVAIAPLTADFHETVFLDRLGAENRGETRISQGPMNPQSLNRYSYTMNNPLKYTDPTGHDAFCTYDYSTCSGGRVYNDSSYDILVKGDLVQPNGEVKRDAIFVLPAHTWSTDIGIVDVDGIVAAQNYPVNGHSSQQGEVTRVIDSQTLRVNDYRGQATILTTVSVGRGGATQQVPANLGWKELGPGEVSNAAAVTEHRDVSSTQFTSGVTSAVIQIAAQVYEVRYNQPMPQARISGEVFHNCALASSGCSRSRPGGRYHLME